MPSSLNIQEIPTAGVSSRSVRFHCTVTEPELLLRRVASHALFDLVDDGEISTPKQVSLEPGSPDMFYSVGHCSSQGKSRKMEDRVLVSDLTHASAFERCRRALLLGVFDGHAGAEAAEHLVSEFQRCLLAAESLLAARDYGGALRQALLRCEAQFLATDCTAGSTALVALMVDGMLHIANVGDCRAVVCDEAMATVLTRDHKPCNELERARLEASGAVVSTDGYVYVGDGCSDIALSRALGGAHMKKRQHRHHPHPQQQQQDDAVGEWTSDSLHTGRHQQSNMGIAQHGTASVAHAKAANGEHANGHAANGHTGHAHHSNGGGHVSGPLAAMHDHQAGVCISRHHDDIAGSISTLCSPGAASNHAHAHEPFLQSLSSTHLSGMSPSDGTPMATALSDTLATTATGLACTAAPHTTAAVVGTAGGSHMPALPQDAGSAQSEGAGGVVIAEPELFQYTIHQGSEFLILASDGVWDKVRNSEAVTRVRRWLAVDELPVEAAAEKLVDYALKLGSHDNASCVVLRFSNRTMPGAVSHSSSVLRRARSEVMKQPSEPALAPPRAATHTAVAGTESRAVLKTSNSEPESAA